MQILVKNVLKDYLEKRKAELGRHNFAAEVRMSRNLFQDHLEETVEEFLEAESISPIYFGIVEGEMSPSSKMKNVNLLIKFTQNADVSEDIRKKALYVLRPYRMKKDNDKRLKVLTAKEYMAILSKIKNPMDLVFIKMIYELGVGVQELVSLKWDDVDFDNKTVKITPQHRKKLLTNVEEVTTFRMSDDLTAALVRYKESSYLTKWVFTSAFFKGSHIEEQTAKDRIRKYGYLIGIEEGISAYSIAQVRLYEKLKNLLDKKVLGELMQEYNLTETQIVSKYMCSFLRGEKNYGVQE